MLTKRQGNSLPFIGLILGSIWQMHWRWDIDSDRCSSEACLASIRNQRYGQLAAQFQSAKPEDNSEWLVPMCTTYTENAKEYDPLFVPYHSFFAFLSDLLRFRRNQQHMAPMIRASAHVSMAQKKYPVSLLERFH